jgi:hypothetical protein
VVEFRSDEPVANYGPYKWAGLGWGRTRERNKQYPLPDFNAWWVTGLRPFLCRTVYNFFLVF